MLVGEVYSSILPRDLRKEYSKIQVNVTSLLSTKIELKMNYIKLWFFNASHLFYFLYFHSLIIVK